jgi:hypothetical protein
VDNRPGGCAQVVDITVETCHIDRAIRALTCDDASPPDVDPTKFRARRDRFVLHIAMSTNRPAAATAVMDTYGL